MIKKIIKILSLLFIIMAMYTIESNASISAGSKTIKSGEKVTVSITSDIPLISYKVSITDLDGLTFVDSSGGTGARNTNYNWGRNTSCTNYKLSIFYI